MVEFRDYQINCINTIHEKFKSTNRQLIQLPTGSGKTYVFLEYLSRHSKRSLIICPSVELVEQIKESSAHFFHKSQFFAKLRQKMKVSQHTVLTAASLNFESTYDFLCEQQFDTIIIDEAHRAQSDTYLKFLQRYKSRNPYFNLLGFTATPERHDKKPLLDLFGEITFDMAIFDLINQGHLCDMKAWRIETKQDLASEVLNGDFRAIELKKLNNDSRNQLILKTVVDKYEKKPTIIFCINIEHACLLAQTLRNEGIKAQEIYGEMPFKRRKEIIRDFKDGKIHVLTNCQLLTEGFDAPCIENIIIARPTRSKSLYCQMIGRGVRNYPGKEHCNLYELTDNNHKICTFNVAAGKDEDFVQDYRPGITLTRHHKDLEDVNIETTIFKETPISLFNHFLDDKSPSNKQLEYLDSKNIIYFNPISFREAAFLIWKDKLKVQYGFN
jgi:ATP-dependent helicase IRC3